MNKYVLLIGGICTGAIGGYLVAKRKLKPIEDPNAALTVERKRAATEKAYTILLDAIAYQTDNPDELSATMQSAIGYLGEALDD